jgi:hypothetical protein
MFEDEVCEVCGFRWADISQGEVPDRCEKATSAFIDTIMRSRSIAGLRPTPERWSILEYGAHLRDVLISIRERIIRASIEEDSIGSPIYRDQRVDLGFYSLDTPDDVSSELEAACQVFERTFRSLPAGYAQRLFQYSPLTRMKVNILWAGAQAVHECEHHLSDVHENEHLLSGATT